MNDLVGMVKLTVGRVVGFAAYGRVVACSGLRVAGRRRSRLESAGVIGPARDWWVWRH
ncbi:hypothetical protein [Nonomuraea longicatena]|uniref:Uncharacterized protein n=1 Tax=Nonomuraea longicatena TaxID=83682 RepID=A0ABN1QCN2_9ACTN